MEDEDSPLIEGWANLLAAASKSYRDEHHIFTGVLAGLSPSDARKLKQLVEGSVPEKLLIIGSFGGNTYREFFHRKFQQLFDGEPGLSFRDYAELRDQVSTYLAGFDAEPTFVWIDDLKGHAFGGDATSEREFVNLERQRLARVDNYRHESALFGGGIALQGQVNYVQLTDFGLRFFETCEGRDILAEVTARSERKEP